MDLVSDQGSEVPTLGMFSGTLSGKWAKVGKMGEKGVNEGNSDCLGKMGNFGAEKAKNQVFGWQQDCEGGEGGGGISESSRGKKGKHGGKWGKMGVGVRFFVICVGKWGKHGVKTPKKPLLSDRLGGGGGQQAPQGEEKWGTIGENGGKWGENPIPPNFSKFPPFLPIFTYFPPFLPIFPYFPPFPPFSPIFLCLGYIVGTFVGTLPTTGAGYF